MSIKHPLHSILQTALSFSIAIVGMHAGCTLMFKRFTLAKCTGVVSSDSLQHPPLGIGIKDLTLLVSIRFLLNVRLQLEFVLEKLVYYTMDSIVSVG